MWVYFIVLHVGTKAARKLPADFDVQKQRYISKIKDLCEEYGIPDDMLVNWDQTGMYCCCLHHF